MNRRPVRVVLVVLAVACVAWRFALLAWLPYDVDELDHAHLAWLTNHGWRFMEGDVDIARTPFLRYFLAPWFSLLGESSLLPYRLVTAAVSWLALVFLFALARRNTGDTEAAAVTAIIFAFSSPFLIPAQQIRFEPFVLFFFLAGFYAYYLAAQDRWRSGWGFAAGLLLGLATCVKLQVLPYLFAFWVVFLARHRRTPVRALAFPVATMALGTALPFLLLLLSFEALLVFLHGRPGGVIGTAAALYGHMARSMPEIHFAVAPYVRGQSVYWILAAAAAVASLGSLWRRPSAVVQVHLLATAIYLAVIPATKRQMYPQDLVFPAVSGALFMGYAWRSLRARLPSWALATALVVVAAEGIYRTELIAADYAREIHVAQTRNADAVRVLDAAGPNPSVRGSLPVLDRVLPRGPYVHVASRTEQDAAIRYLNATVRGTDVAMTSSSLNVFRPSAHDWSQAMVLFLAMGMEPYFAVGRAAPWLIVYGSCVADHHIIDYRQAGFGEALVRDLDRSRPRVILLDRFYIDLLRTYPEYLRAVDGNYRVTYHEPSRVFFALREAAAWAGPSLPALPPLPCDASAPAAERRSPMRRAGDSS